MKKLSFIMVLCLTLMMSSCQFSKHGEIFDDEDKMVAEGDTFSFLGRYETNQFVSFKRFSGIYTLKRITEDDDFVLNIDFDITSGRFKCFLVTKDDEIIELTEGDNMIQSDGSRLRLRIAGDNAVGEMRFTIQ